MENEVAEFKMQRGYELGEGSGKKKHMLAQAFQKGMEGYGDEPKWHLAVGKRWSET